jgi:hypothetical protein
MRPYNFKVWGYPPETRLAMPLAPAYVAVAVWLAAISAS